MKPIYLLPLLVAAVSLFVSSAAKADDSPDIYQQAARNEYSVAHDQEVLRGMYQQLEEHRRSGGDITEDLRAIASEKQSLQDDMGRLNETRQTYQSQTGQSYPGARNNRHQGWNQSDRNWNSNSDQNNWQNNNFHRRRGGWSHSRGDNDRRWD
jgi:septal ring factor EnvC (AmiA/AmiB activator)